MRVLLPPFLMGGRRADLLDLGGEPGGGIGNANSVVGEGLGEDLGDVHDFGEDLGDGLEGDCDLRADFPGDPVGLGLFLLLYLDGFASSGFFATNSAWNLSIPDLIEKNNSRASPGKR